MIRYYIAIALVAVVPRVTIGDRGDVPVEKIKLPTAITVSGKMTCNKIGVYAVLINVVEEVKYLTYSGRAKGDFRISRYYLSGRDGTFKIRGNRYVATDALSLNITHNCVPFTKRQQYRNCFTQTRHKIRSDSKSITFDLGELSLDQQSYQGTVQCRDWPYEYPDFVKKYNNAHN